VKIFNVHETLKKCHGFAIKGFTLFSKLGDKVITIVRNHVKVQFYQSVYIDQMDVHFG
jgi:hypothetical protein